MYLGSVVKLVRQLQRRRSGGNSDKKGATKHKKRDFTQNFQNISSREYKGVVGDNGVSLTPEVGWCMVVQMFSKINSR
jgi:hypothetical protein